MRILTNIPFLGRSRVAVLALLIAAALFGILLWLVPSLTTATSGSNLPVDTVARTGLYTSLVLDASDYPVVSYFDQTNRDLKVLHCGDANCISGNSFAAPDTADIVGQYTSLALDSSGYPVVSYYDQTNGDLKILHCGDANCTSGNSITSPDGPANVGKYTSLALDTSGYPVVTYINSTKGEINLMHCNDANCSGGDESITAVGTVGIIGAKPSLALDASGYPVISYTDTASSLLKVVHCNDANCVGGDESITSPDTEGFNGFNSSLALDASGFPVVSYFEATASDFALRVLHCGDANCTSDNSIASPDTGINSFTFATRTSLALDGNGYPVVSYEDGSGLRLLHCGNANCTSGNSITYPNTDDGLWSSLALDASGYPVVSYYVAFEFNFTEDLWVLHCGDANCAPKPPTPVPGVDDNMTSRGKFQILVSPDFRDLMAGYPGYDGISRLDSPNLYDPSTVVGRSVYHLDGDATDTGGAGVGSAGTSVSDSDFSLLPDGFEGPAGSREVHTEIRSMNLTAGAVAVRAGTNAPDQPISPGEVESQSASGNPADDFPADSFFNVFVEVDLPGVSLFDGATLYNSDPLLVVNNNVTSLPPRVVYVHGNSSAVPVFFKSDNLPDWAAGDLFGWLALAGHGAGFDDSFEDIAEFEQIYQQDVASDPLPVPDSDGGGAPDDLEIFEAGDIGNPADDAAILALDSDGDGCTSAQEYGEFAALGGQRDPLNPHDYYDVNDDKIIDLSNDIFGVILEYAPSGYVPGTIDHTGNKIVDDYDRGPTAGPNPWNMTAPDGVIDLSIDILGVILQYNHSCQ